MRKYIVAFVAAFAVFAAVAVAAPAVTVADFASDSSPEANQIWLILAGQGFWGAILFGILGLVWRIAKPYLDDWARQRRLDKLLLAIESGVGAVQQIYVEGMKAANEDGKLTEEEKAAVLRRCKDYVVSFLKTQGIDVIKEYGEQILEWLIEFILGKMKLNNALSKAVVVPLPDLEP